LNVNAREFVIAMKPVSRRIRDGTSLTAVPKLMLNCRKVSRVSKGAPEQRMVKSDSET
jgi:hypothetical protein